MSFLLGLFSKLAGGIISFCCCLRLAFTSATCSAIALLRILCTAIVIQLRSSRCTYGLQTLKATVSAAAAPAKPVPLPPESVPMW